LKLAGKKIIYDAHEHFSSAFFAYLIVRYPSFKKIEPIIKFLLVLWEKFFTLFVDYIITVSEPFKKEYMKYKRPVEVVSNYPAVYPLPKITFTPSEKFILVHTGYFDGIKDFESRGIKELIVALKEVTKKYKNISLWMVGAVTMNSSEKELIENFIIRNNVKDIIKFFGHVPYNEMFNYISKANAGIALIKPIDYCYKMALPNKLFEYMALGKPIIGTSTCIEIAKVINNERCGITVDPTKPEEIARAIVYLIEHPEEAEKMGKRGRKAVEEKYNLREIEKKLIKIYRNL